MRTLKNGELGRLLRAELDQASQDLAGGTELSAEQIKLLNVLSALRA